MLIGLVFVFLVIRLCSFFLGGNKINFILLVWYVDYKLHYVDPTKETGYKKK